QRRWLRLQRGPRVPIRCRARRSVPPRRQEGRRHGRRRRGNRRLPRPGSCRPQPRQAPLPLGQRRPSADALKRRRRCRPVLHKPQRHQHAHRRHLQPAAGSHPRGRVLCRRHL
ncbi:hypothetical protein BN1708_018244, partial [Verticillium longisporum]